MGLFEDIDDLGKKAQQKREQERVDAEAAKKAGAERAKTAAQHKENKEQGMI